MRPITHTHIPWPRTRLVQGAFTFIEVMFAVVLLGVGLTFCAAMFPVAASQLRRNLDDAHAASLAVNAVASISAHACDQSMPPTNGAVRCPAEFWSTISGDSRNTADPSLAWSAMYRRESGESFAQVWVIALRAKNREIFSSDDFVSPSDEPAPLQPRPVRVTLNDGVGGPDIATFRRNDQTFNNQAIGPGAFLVIAEDGDGGAVGKVYQIGNARPDLGPDAWELMPGHDMRSDSENVEAVIAMVVGRPPANPDQPQSATNPPSGEVQDIGIYTSYVQLR